MALHLPCELYEYNFFPAIQPPTSGASFQKSTTNNGLLCLIAFTLSNIILLCSGVGINFKSGFFPIGMYKKYQPRYAPFLIKKSTNSSLVTSSAFLLVAIEEKPKGM